ncbi:uncharacterized protein [Dermacentor albipictus]|uniref:uncharacterized protein n=1 Tax=Dermacentor albipictus TaxID=60249 RepID=UPI0038FCB87B
MHNWLRVERDKLNALICKVVKRALGLPIRTHTEDRLKLGKPPYLMDETNPDWAPSLQLGYTTNPTDLAEGRHKRRSKRARSAPHCVTAGHDNVLQPCNSAPQGPKTCLGKLRNTEVRLGDASTALANVPATCTAEVDKPAESSARLAAGFNKVQQPCYSEPQGSKACSEVDKDTDIGVEDAATAPAEVPTACAAEAAEYLPVATSDASATAFAAPDMPTVEVVQVKELHTQTTDVTCVQDAETQTEVTKEYIDSLESDNRDLRLELSRLKKQVSRLKMTQSSLQEDEIRVKFYTGLPSYAMLIASFNIVEGSVPHGGRNALTKFQEFLVTLIRLRLGVPVQDLAYRFCVSQATVTRILERWLDVMHIRLSKLVEWPDREELQLTMSMCFRRAFGTTVAVIIDCFEVFLERPSSVLPRCQTWSRYKHHNTVKYLIGIAPQGSITYISKGWGRRTSDKLLTERCGIQNNLQPGDTVLADRGFTIADAVGIHCAQLEVRAFTKGERQLTAWEVEKTRKIANVRIHVKRVIGLLRRKYAILSSIIPIELVMVRSGDTAAQLEKIVTVCAALTNLCKSVVPFQ